MAISLSSPGKTIVSSPPAAERLPDVPASRAGRRFFLVALVLHAVVMASLWFGYLNGLFNDATQRFGQGVDFFAVYQAGTNFLNDHLVYAAPGAAASVPYLYPFRYLPSVAYTLGALLNLLPAWRAYWSWVAFNELLLLLNVVLTWRACRGSRIRPVACGMWLAFTPFYLELFMGQFSFLMASLFFWMGLGLARSARRVSATSWTLSLAVKSNSLLFAPLWLRDRRLTAMCGGLVLVAALNAPYFVLEPHALHFWLGNFSGFIHSHTPSAPTHAGALGFRSLLAIVQGAGAGQSGSTEATVAAVARLPVWIPAILLLSGLATFSRRLDDVGVLALWVATYFLVFSDVWEHHYVMLLPVLVLLVVYQPRLRLVALLAWALVALPTPYFLFQLWNHVPEPPAPRAFWDPQVGWSAVEVVIYHLSKALPTLLLWLALLWQALTGRRPVQEPLIPEDEAVVAAPAIATGAPSRPA